jgi:tRNA A-37 threonylcarbamoyl transferase component Bud32
MLRRLPEWAAAEAEVYKSDRRSRVWLALDPEGVGWVVKRYEQDRGRQRVAWGVGMHPAQREARASRRLERAGVSVTPVAGLGMQAGRGWLMTRWMGDSVQRVVAGGGLDEGATDRLMRDLGRLSGQLLVAGWWNRDHKASNHVLDGRGRLWLIDVGGVRPRLGRLHRPVESMAGMLEQTLAADRGRGLTQGEREAYVEGLEEVFGPGAGVLRTRSSTL